MKRFVLSVWLAFALAGCSVAATQVAERADDQAKILAYETDANKGDAVAQYKMGTAHCCTIAGSMGVLNNQEATHWFCKAAYQDNADAQYELGRIYSGDLVRGINGPAQIASMVTDQPMNKPLALMWFGLAYANGNPDAAEKAKDLSKNMTPGEITEAAFRKKKPHAQPCEWNDVYPDHKL